MTSEGYFKTPNYSQSSGLVSYADRAFHKGKEAVVGRSWGPLVLIARTTIVALMEKIQYGQLRVLTTGDIYTFGNPKVGPGVPGVGEDGELKAEIKVVNDAFWVRMLVLCDLGFSEAYMAQDIEVDNLENIFKMFILNREHLSELGTSTSRIFTGLQYLMNSRFVNSISNSISNISAHYDISNEMFEAFLSKDMTYSCGIYPPIDAPPSESEKRSEDDLENAQYAKIQHIIDRANIRKGDRVLEIGSGWASFAIEAVQTRGCTVDTLTLSIEQKKLAEERIEKAGLSESIKVHLMDYRNMPKEWEKSFDRVVSIEMIEAVGLEFLDTYFKMVDFALKADNGVGVFQVITIPERRFERYQYEIDFIRKYIFPGGVLPSVTCLTNAISKGSKNTLVLEALDNIGPHYAPTLREWKRRFTERYESRIVPALKSAYPELKTKQDAEVFRRKWIYYFDYCAAGFAMRVINDHIFTVSREGNLTAGMQY